MLSDNVVSIAGSKDFIDYEKEPPFRPSKIFPEFQNRLESTGQNNVIYDVFRELLCNLNMDIAHFGTSDWNPLGEIIKPGQKVLIKPNLVRHIHLTGGDYRSVVTHASLIRCVLDYVALALKNFGEIVVGDAPVQSTDFSALIERTGLDKVCADVSEVWGIPVHLKDFRLWSVTIDESHRVLSSKKLTGDPSGYAPVDLGKHSLLVPLNNDSDKFQVTSYDCAEMRDHHNTKKHEYLIPKAVLNADVIINLPKLKTHRKVAITAALKNLVGINGFKDWLPHHRSGSISEGGDEYKNRSFLKRLQSHLFERTNIVPDSSLNPLRLATARVAGKVSRRFSPDTYSEGSWYGNDTLWRTVLDLNRLLIYANSEGFITDTPQRNVITFVDAMIAGEGEGPMEPDSRTCGLLVGGRNPVAVDAVLATMIGFDYKNIPMIANGFEINDLPLTTFKISDIALVTNDTRFEELMVGKPFNVFCFTPPAGWMNHVELPGCKRVAQRFVTESSLRL